MGFKWISPAWEAYWVHVELQRFFRSFHENLCILFQYLMHLIILDTADFWLIEKSMFCFHVYVVKKLLTTWTRSGPRFFIAYQTITNIWPQVFNQELVYFIKLKCINICCECLKKIINQLTMYETAFSRTLVFWENDLKWAFPFGKFRKSSETVWSTHVL